jgi:hypothetical protein
MSSRRSPLEPYNGWKWSQPLRLLERAD